MNGKAVLNPKYCPLCGTSSTWDWTIIRHVLLDGTRVVHVKIVTATETLATLLFNGKAQ